VAEHYGRSRVPLYRLAQFLEFGSKALWRVLAPVHRDRNRALAGDLWRKARLQLVDKLAAAPPSRDG